MKSLAQAVGAVREPSNNAHNVDVEDDVIIHTAADTLTVDYIPRNDPVLCFYACQTALRNPVYTDVAREANLLYKECHSRLMQTSIFLCVRSNCRDTKAIDDGSSSSFDYRTVVGLVRLNTTCATYMGAPLPPIDRVLEAYPDDVVARLRRLQRYEANRATNISTPVVTSEQLYENAYDTLSTWDEMQGYHWYYSYLIFYFWCAVVVYGVCSRVFAAVSHRLRRRSRRLVATVGTRRGPGRGHDEQLLNDAAQEEHLLESDTGEDSSPRFRRVGHHIASRPRVWLLRYLVLPATFGGRCAQDFGWYTVPPRVQTITLAVFAALNLYGCATGYRVFPGNMWWPEIWRQYARHVSDRTGILSFVNFPLVWLFGMRNNMLQSLTGWDFGTYNNFHRWIARIATVEAIVHSVGFTLLECRDGGWPAFVRWWRLFWWWTGGVATILMSLLLGLSVFWLRRRAYELFLVIHILFSVCILLGMVFHVSIFHGRYDLFWQSAAVIWILDRGLRTARILAFNPLFWRTRAKVTYDPQANIIRLIVPYSSSLYQPQPGTYYYLHVLNDKRFWESHPFTVATVTSLVSASSSSSSLALQTPHGEADSPTGPSQVHDTTYGINQPFRMLYRPDDEDNDNGNEELQRPLTRESAVSASSVPPSTPAHAASTLTFLIRPYDSFTGRLRDYASGVKGGSGSGCSADADADADVHRTATVRVLVDGPYGHAHRFDDGVYDSVLFMAGGSGIVVAMSHLTGIAHDRMAAELSSSPQQPYRLRRVHIVWAVREAAFAAAVLREDLQGVVFGGPQGQGGVTGVHVSLDIHVTQRRHGAENSSDADAADTLFGDLPPSVRVLYDRPDVRGEIECAAKHDTARGRLAVVACGPGRMADEARRAVVHILGQRGTTSDIEYLEESFQW